MTSSMTLYDVSEKKTRSRTGIFKNVREIKKPFDTTVMFSYIILLHLRHR